MRLPTALLCFVCLTQQAQMAVSTSSTTSTSYLLPTATKSLFLASSLLLLSSSNAFVPPINNEDWESVQDYRRRMGMDYTYQTKSIHKEVCRYLTEDECKKMDDDFGEQAKRNRDQLNPLNPHKRQLRPLNPQKLQVDEPDTALPQPDTGETTSDKQVSQTTTGVTFKVLVCMIQWKDHMNRSPLPTRDDIDLMWNGVGTSEDFIKGGSITNWTSTNSYGQVTLEATVIDWYQADETEKYYADGRSAVPNGGDTADLLEIEAITPLLTKLDQDGFDFSEFDLNGDNVLDTVVFVHSGYPAELGNPDCETSAEPIDRIQSIARGSGQVAWRGTSGFTLGNFAIVSALSGFCNLNNARIGVTTHEFMHTVGLPDLYDLGGRLNPTGSVGGIGAFDIM
jgi:M6 family metalloprotease-like protein